MEQKQIISLIATLIYLYSFFPYFLSIRRRETRPHLFTWLLWAILSGVNCAIQIAEGGGDGVWLMMVMSLENSILVWMALRYGEKNVTFTDWFALIAGLATIPLWVVTKNPFWSVFLTIVIDVFAFYPTVRKSWLKPYQEAAHPYVIVAFSTALSIFALDRAVFTTAGYSLCIVLLNVCFVFMLVLRRRLIINN